MLFFGDANNLPILKKYHLLLNDQFPTDIRSIIAAIDRYNISIYCVQRSRLNYHAVALAAHHHRHVSARADAKSVVTALWFTTHTTASLVCVVVSVANKQHIAAVPTSKGRIAAPAYRNPDIPYTSQWAGRCSQIMPTFRGSGPRLIHGSLDPPESTPETASRFVQPFCAAHGCGQQVTYTQTTLHL